MITNAAMKNGFTGGLIVDFPNSKKAKKYFLFLMAGYSDEVMSESKSVIMPEAKVHGEGYSDPDDDGSDDSDDSENEGGHKKKIGVSGR